MYFSLKYKLKVFILKADNFDKTDHLLSGKHGAWCRLYFTGWNDTFDCDIQGGRIRHFQVVPPPLINLRKQMSEWLEREKYTRETLLSDFVDRAKFWSDNRRVIIIKTGRVQTTKNNAFSMFLHPFF